MYVARVLFVLAVVDPVCWSPCRLLCQHLRMSASPNAAHHPIKAAYTHTRLPTH